MDIFVANLNFKVQSEQLQQIFEDYGQVESARIIIDKKTRKSKGYGFVQMPNDREAQEAIKELNGKEIDGRPIVVKESSSKE